jgi:phosphoribosyl-AMP cyclohydrolase
MSMSKSELEHGREFAPRFDANGLLCAVIVDETDNAVLMVGYMNQASLELSQETGFVHFYSRSRQTLWKKGETSGHVLQIRQILVDCDQDALVIRVKPAGPTCHTGERSCFYRTLEGDALVPVKA